MKNMHSSWFAGKWPQFYASNFWTLLWQASIVASCSWSSLNRISHQGSEGIRQFQAMLDFIGSQFMVSIWILAAIYGWTNRKLVKITLTGFVQWSTNLYVLPWDQISPWNCSLITYWQRSLPPNCPHFNQLLQECCWLVNKGDWNTCSMRVPSSRYF